MHSIADPTRNILVDCENVARSDEDSIPTINDVESLKKGIINTSKNRANRPYTILLLGETGVGKSSLVEFIGNVLTSNDIDHFNFNILDPGVEQAGLDNQSQTTAAHWYEFTSENGIMVRLLDTPGLADTRSFQRDGLHKWSIATQIKEHTDPIIAVLVLTNDAVPHLTVGTDNELSTLSARFPKYLAHKVSLLFTNVLSPPHLDFSLETIPHELRGAPRFLLNNPIPLQRTYLRIKDDPNMEKRIADLRNRVKTAEQNAFQMLVELFDWLDSLEPQRTTEIVTRSQEREIMSAVPPSPMAIDSAGMNQWSIRNLLKPPWLRRRNKPRLPEQMKELLKNVKDVW